jgi:hypothetical protein
MIRGDLNYNGLKIGARWAIRYATGTRADRREIRRRLGRMAGSYGTFARAVFEGYELVAADLARGILEGRRPRSCNPHKLARVLERV